MKLHSTVVPYIRDHGGFQFLIYILYSYTTATSALPDINM